jgi:hypothetical protein
MSMLPDLQRWCPNHWLNLQLIKVDLSKWTELTPQQDGKSTTSHQDDAALWRRQHKRKQLKNSIYVKNHLFKLKAEKKDAKGWF